MDTRTAVKTIKDILINTPEKSKELRSLVSSLYFTYKDTDYRDFILSLLRFISSPPESFEQNYAFACLPKRKHTDIPRELFEYIRKNISSKTPTTVITTTQTPIQATYKEALVVNYPSTSSNNCIIFIRQEDPEFFKNAPFIIEQASRLPIYRLNNSLFPESKIPVFNFDNNTFTHAFLWTDRYYINNRKPFTTSEPFLKDDTVIGPLKVDLALFKEHYDKILTYPDIAYGYLKETNTQLSESSNVFTVNRKVCCSTAREMYSKDIIYIPDQGKEFLYSIGWLNDQIQGDK